MTEWTEDLERQLFDYVVQHTDRNRQIDWSELPVYFPRLNYNICYAKYYRMKKDRLQWNFARALYRKFTKEDQDEYERHLVELIMYLSAM